MALTIAQVEGVPDALMKKALSEFEGVKRRFTRTGEVNGITIIDDYGHHPVEISAVLKAARMAVEERGGKIHAVMQPHRFSRLQDLFDEFATCFDDADSVLIADVYAASETPIEGIDKEHLVESIMQHGHKDAACLSSPHDLAELISNKAESGDMVIFLGAGDITKWAYALPEELEKVFESSKRQAS